MYYLIESSSDSISPRQYQVNYGFDLLSHIKLSAAKALSTTNLSSLLILFIALFLFPAVVLPAQSPDLGRPMFTHEAKAGTLLVRGDDQDPFRPAPMVGTDVEIKVTGMIARAVVTQHDYRVTGTAVVHESATEVMALGDQKKLTLITCFPFDAWWSAALCRGGSE